MGIRRLLSGLTALLIACLPAVLFWLLTFVAIDRRDAARADSTVPNPARAPGWYFGFLDVLVYADPYFAGTIFYQWLLPGAVLLAVFGLWAAGVPILSKERAPGWPVPKLRKVAGASLAAGVFLAIPWVYAWLRVVCTREL